MSFQDAIEAIDKAHRMDPNKLEDGTPYELVYADKCTHYLDQLTTSPSEALKLAVRAQHLQRWEVPRDTYPMTKPGYFSWRTGLKKRQGELAASICTEAGYDATFAGRVASMIRKDNFKKDDETQTLEDVACLVFLDDQFEAFNKEHSEEKIIHILRKTWPKMSEAGHAIALTLPMSDEAASVVQKALSL